MEELSADEFEEVMQAKPPRSRKKAIERTYHAWFYDIETSLGNCDNPECMDTRSKSSCFVWEHPSELHMCRFCFVGGWLKDES